jgi:glycine/D-amino acid oxidase-like deaminating enzyme
MRSDDARVAILGAGLQGACIALELARQGIDVTLVDQDVLPLNRASLRNEGKIHLGLVYANDPTLATARLQLEGALTFRSLLARWLGTAADALTRSTPFHYLVARDSMLDRDAIHRHYEAVQALYDERRRVDAAVDYLGTRPERLYAPVALPGLAPMIRIERFAAAFATAELAIDPDELATRMRAALAATPRIRFLPARRVEAVACAGGRYLVEGSGPEGPWRLGADQVVNATWESRRALDATLGLDGGGDRVLRLRYRLIARVPAALRGGPSITMVLGPYGDVVHRPDGTAYLSWYPAGLQGWSLATEPPAAWQGPCRGDRSEEAAPIATEILHGIDAWLPGIARSEPITIDAGIIVAAGRTDIDDRSSGLHDRTKVGVTSSDGYHSVDAGKLTTAPLFALAAARVVVERAS